MTKKTGPVFLKYFQPIIDVLLEQGGSANSKEVIELVIEKLNISEEEVEEKLKSGASRVKNQIAWARIYLVKSGYLDDSSKRGVWSLTEKGMENKLKPEDHHEIFSIIQRKFTKRDEVLSDTKENSLDIENAEELNDDLSSEQTLLEILQSLPPKGFERICQRLLRESGFKRVVVTGKTGDGGIDGEGILEINPLMSFKVLFQSKRFKGSVGSGIVRDFRGAMHGRADKGIIITTGTFTKEAIKEATREGTYPIELVDGEKLVELFEKTELGMKPKIVYEIDYNFFGEFMDDE